MTFDATYARYPAWMPDGRSVLYSGGDLVSPSLFRVWIRPTVAEPHKPVQIPGAGVGVRFPSVSNNGRLAFSQGIIDADIWRVDLTKRTGTPESGNPIKVVASTRLDHTVRISPDGERLAFASERSGSPEIWVSGADGKNPMQLTHFDGGYTAGPAWSPDGRWISFSSRAGGRTAVYTVSSQGGAIKRLTDPRASSCGSWSPDAQWIYCGMQGQLWKFPPAGGAPVQITRSGGGPPAQSVDGRTIFYAKEGSGLDITRLWSVPAEGGEEREVLPAVFAANVVVRSNGIYFVPGREKPAIWFYRFADRKISRVAALRAVPAYGMDVSKDGRFALVPEYEDSRSDIMMIENFR